MRQVTDLLNSSTFRAIVSGQRTGLLNFVFRLFLRVVAIPYRAVVTLRNVAFDRGWRKIHRVDIPTISIGNITLGGTGKTPTVVWLIEWLLAHNIKPAIVSRGYKGRPGEKNDEA